MIIDAKEARRFSYDAISQGSQEDSYDKKKLDDILTRIESAALRGKRSVSVECLDDKIVRKLNDLGFEYQYQQGGIGGSYYEVTW